MAENKKESKPSLYSSVGYANPEGDLAQSKVNISYWNGNMKISIWNKEGTPENYTYKEAANIYLPYTKAMILSRAITMVMTDVTSYAGTTAGNGFIGVTKTDGGYYLLTIIDFSNTQSVSDDNMAIYQFKDQHHYVISDMNVHDDGTFDHNKQFLPELELEMLKMACDQFANAMTMTYAYTNMVASQYDARLNRIFPIAAQLGVTDYKSNGGYRASNANDVFNNNGNTGAPITSGSIDDIM